MQEEREEQRGRRTQPLLATSLPLGGPRFDFRVPSAHASFVGAVATLQLAVALDLGEFAIIAGLFGAREGVLTLLQLEAMLLGRCGRLA
jgi:hypothetical protein